MEPTHKTVCDFWTASFRETTSFSMKTECLRFGRACAKWLPFKRNSPERHFFKPRPSSPLQSFSYVLIFLRLGSESVGTKRFLFRFLIRAKSSDRCRSFLGTRQIRRIFFKGFANRRGRRVYFGFRNWFVHSKNGRTFPVRICSNPFRQFQQNGLGRTGFPRNRKSLLFNGGGFLFGIDFAKDDPPVPPTNRPLRVDRPTSLLRKFRVPYDRKRPNPHCRNHSDRLRKRVRIRHCQSRWAKATFENEKISDRIRMKARRG